MQKSVTARAKRFLVVALITVTLGTSPQIAASAKEYTVSGQTSQKLYESASENSKAVANVIPGNSFTILETVKDAQGRNWHHVLLTGGTTGYIIASRVIENATETPEEPAETQAPEEPAAEEPATETPENTERVEGAADAEEEQNQEELQANPDVEGNTELTDTHVRILSNTNLRDEPSLNGHILVIIPKDVTVRPLEKIEADHYFWYKLTYLTQTGYVRADTVEEFTEESTEESGENQEVEVVVGATEDTSEKKSGSTSSSTSPIYARSKASTTVSYEDSYDRRHKWDDPEVTAGEEIEIHKRAIDIYVLVFVFLAAVLLVIGLSIFGSAFRSMKRYLQINRKIRKKVGSANGQNDK